MSGCQRHNDHSAAPALDLSRANDGFFRVITTLHDYIWLQEFDEIERRVLGKNYNEVYAFECSKHVRALGVAANRTSRALQSANGFVAIDPDDQRIGTLSRRAQDVDVPGMEQVKNAVGECDLPFLCRAPPLCIDPRRDFAGRIAWLQSLLAAIGWKCSTCSFLNGSLITSS